MKKDVYHRSNAIQIIIHQGTRGQAKPSQVRVYFQRLYGLHPMLDCCMWDEDLTTKHRAQLPHTPRLPRPPVANPTVNHSR